MNRLFFGWYIVFASLVLGAYQSALFSYGLTAFINPIIATFGWTYTQISFASTLQSIENGAFGPIWGKIVDRYSPRKLMLLGVITTAVGIFIMSQTVNLGMYYAGFLIMSMAASLYSGMVPLVVIARWFRKDFGKANGLFLMGSALGGVLMPVLVNVIDTFGWQNTLLGGSIGLLVLGVPLSFVFRNPPGGPASVPDRKEPPGAAATVPVASDTGAGVRESLKSRAFWQISLYTMFQTIAISVVFVYTIPYLTSIGMDRATAGVIVMLYTLVSISIRVPLGMLADRFVKKYVVAATIFLMAAGLVAFLFFRNDSPFWLILLFAVPFGLGLAGAQLLRQLIVRDYFGTKNLGIIFGLIGVAATIGSALSAPAAGLIIDTSHDYRTVWLISVASFILALVMIITIPSVKSGAKKNTPAE